MMDDPNSQNKYAGQNLAGTDAASSYAQRKGMSELTKNKHEKDEGLDPEEHQGKTEGEKQAESVPEDYEKFNLDAIDKTKANDTDTH